MALEALGLILIPGRPCTAYRTKTILLLRVIKITSPATKVDSEKIKQDGVKKLFDRDYRNFAIATSADMLKCLSCLLEAFHKQRTHQDINDMAEILNAQN